MILLNSDCVARTTIGQSSKTSINWTFNSKVGSTAPFVLAASFLSSIPSKRCRAALGMIPAVMFVSKLN
uniref:Uncharacterized protein n=1 Tax=Meloidogyne incognita TaxID=6306 RepID=A0A914M8M0_MELIC